MIRTLSLATFCAQMAPALAPASAQGVYNLPPFTALQQQQQQVDRQRADDLRRQQQDLDRLSRSQGQSPTTQAERDLQQIENQAQRQQLHNEIELQRQQTRREQQAADNALINQRIPSFSSTVVTNPSAYILPEAPKGDYYARINGRFVLVDGTSQLVVKVLDPQPTDPTGDVPLGPRARVTPSYGTRIGPNDPNPLPHQGPDWAGPILPQQPALPRDVIKPDSPSVIRDYAKASLSYPPQGYFYAELNKRIYLVDGSTNLPFALIRDDSKAPTKSATN